MENKVLKIGFVYDIKIYIDEMPLYLKERIDDDYIEEDENGQYIIYKSYLIKKKDNILSKLYIDKDYFELNSYQYDSSDDYYIIKESDYLFYVDDVVLAIEKENIIKLSENNKKGWLGNGKIFTQNAIIGGQYYIIDHIVNSNLKVTFNGFKKKTYIEKFSYNNKKYKHTYMQPIFTYNDYELKDIGTAKTILKKVV